MSYGWCTQALEWLNDRNDDKSIIAQPLLSLDGQTPLHVACFYNHHRAVEQLLNGLPGHVDSWLDVKDAKGISVDVIVELLPVASPIRHHYRIAAQSSRARRHAASIPDPQVCCALLLGCHAPSCVLLNASRCKSCWQCSPQVLQ
jgi:Ankyrin repeat